MPEEACNHDDFDALTQRHRHELMLHCYRMLGSVADAEDAAQEAFVRAWRGFAGFEGRSSARRWLYRIATNVCLDALARRRRRVLPADVGPASDPAAPMAGPASEVLWIEPIQPSLLVHEPARGPDARYGARESVALAFVTALQALPGKQRAALLLCDVLGFTAHETAQMLDSSTAAINSALQRARATLSTRRGGSTAAGMADAAAGASLDGPVSADVAADLVARFVRAWEASDASGLVALLTEDVVFAMPPLAMWLRGRADVSAFLQTALFAPGFSFRALATNANAQPAVAVYRRAPGGDVYTAEALGVLTMRADAVAEVQTFLTMGSVALFERFELPTELP